MNNLRRLGLAISLAVVLAGPTLAGETSTPPCVNPGETSTPPCSSQQYVTDEAGETSSNVSDEVETLAVEAAMYAIESLLTLF
jgi:hypothetical protein